MSLDIQVIKVTPTMAEKWLNSNTENRKMRDGVAERYADDMRDGRWTQCPEPISFYDDGALADGQHRLWAIIDSGKSIVFPVARGLARSDGLNINTGLGRTLVDNARISGKNPELTNELIGVSRAVAEGLYGKGSQSPAHRLAQVEAHEVAAKWAVANGPRGKFLRNVVIIAAVARAYYHETDLDRLRRFSDVVSTGFYDGDGEQAAVAIRNYLQERGAVSSTAALWRDTFLKVQNAIRYFMKGKPLSVIKSIKDEPYPLPKA